MTTATAPRLALPETQRRARGHRFTPPAADSRRIPALYATDSTPLADKVLHLHYFTGGHDWYVAEVDPATGEAFGLVIVNGEREWTYFRLGDLEAVRSQVLGAGRYAHLVERDCWYTRGTAAEVSR